MRTQAERDARMSVITDELDRLARFDTLTAQQTATRTKLLAERETLSRETAEEFLAVRREQVRQAAREQGLIEHGTDTWDRDPVGDRRDVAARFRGDPWADSVTRAAPGPFGSWGPAELRSRALTACERASGTTDKARERLTGIIEQFDNVRGDLARQVILTSSPEYISAFSRALAGDMDLLSVEERAALRAVRDLTRAMSLTDAAGGFLVPVQLDPTVMLDSEGSVSAVRRLARRVVATGDIWNGVSAEAVSSSYDAEASEVSDDSPTLAGPSVTIRTQRTFLPFSLEVSQDAAGNWTQELVRLMVDAKDQCENDAFVNGTAGANQPVGIVSALFGTARAYTANQAGTFAVEDVAELFATVGPRYQGTASWLMNVPEALVVGGFQIDNTIALADVATSAMGRPVALCSPLAAGKVVFGDVGAGYVVADRLGFQVELVPHLVGQNLRPTGQRGLFGFVRHGGNVVVPRALSLLTV